MGRATFRKLLLALLSLAGVLHVSGCGPEVFIAMAFASDTSPFTSEFWDIFEPAPDPAVRLVMSRQPSTSAGPGAAFSVQPQVTIVREDGSRVEDDNSTWVTATIVPGTGTAGATLSGATTIRASGGRATFTNLSIDRPGNSYRLAFTAPSLLSATSEFFNVGSGMTTASMAILTQPGGATPGNPLARQPVIELRSISGARHTQDNYTQVTASITTGSGTTGASLLGTVTVTAQAGLATFLNLAIDLAGAAYSLTFSANPVLPTRVSASFEVLQLGPGNAPFAPAAPVGSAVYFVAPSGSDSNPGTSAQPFRTLQPAANLAQPGDIIELAPGSYPRAVITITATLAQPVVIRGIGAVFDSGTSAAAPDGLLLNNCTYLTLYGLRVHNALGAGIALNGGSFVALQAVTCANCGGAGVAVDVAADVTVEGATASGCMQAGIVVTGGSDRITLRGNYCHFNGAQGIDLRGSGQDNISSNNLIARNLCVGNALAGLRLGSVRDSDVLNNLLRNNQGHGIELRDDGLGAGFGSVNNRLLHNTVAFAASEGLFALALLDGSSGNTVSHNLLVGGARGAIAFTSSSLGGLAEDFNVLHSLSAYSLAEEPLGASYNLTGWRGLTGGAVNSLDAAPQFTSVSTGDYSLAAGSPGVDIGGSTSASSTYDGQARPQGAARDAGCHER